MNANPLQWLNRHLTREVVACEDMPTVPRLLPKVPAIAETPYRAKAPATLCIAGTVPNPSCALVDAPSSLPTNSPIDWYNRTTVWFNRTL